MTPSGQALADADRLPWLEPYREPRRDRARPVALIGTLAILGSVGGAGYWLGQREPAEPVVEARAVQSSQTAVVPLPEPTAVATPARPAEAEPNIAPPIARAQAEAEAKGEVAEPSKAPVRSGRPARKIGSAGVETGRRDAVRSRQPQPAAAVRQANPPRVWPRMPSPGPAGQVVQLGAFSHPDRAYNAYRQRLARDPSLAALPRVIVPIVVRPSGRMLYVLRLGTGSRQQSKTLCRNLRRSGDHCIVIG